MSINRKNEDRALDKAEQELVTKTHHPELQSLEDKELANLIKLVRERRDKARGEVQRRKREMRGKAEPKRTSAATSAIGNKIKLEVLATALKRLNAERSRRERMASQLSQFELSRRALKNRKSREDNTPSPPNTRHAHKGMRNIASKRRENLIRPMELGRQRKAAAVAQAKRDSR